MASPDQLRHTILIVEDNEANLAVYSSILSHVGYKVVEAASGEDALIKARTESPDLITMDISLPGIDGFEVTRILKKDPSTNRIPIIALTAHALEADRTRAIAAGMDGYLAKPVEPRRVIQEIERFIGPNPSGSNRLKHPFIDPRINESRGTTSRRTERTSSDEPEQVPDDHSITVSFVFPEEVRTSCEQYLLYFAEFLKDVGIRATADLRHRAGEVLFSVTPEDPKIALEKLHRALTIYLQLPDDPELSHALGKAGDIRALRLLANIQTFHAQMSYARAALEAKNETIAALHSRIADMMSPSSAATMVGSGQSAATSPSRESVELLGGAVELVPWEGKGVRIDTARIFHWFKRLIESDDKD